MQKWIDIMPEPSNITHRFTMEQKKYGSLDAGFFWKNGRPVGCLVSIVLLFLPIITLFYGIYAMWQQGVDYELDILPLDTLRCATAIAITLFAPLLPFRLWLLINALEMEKIIDKSRDHLYQKSKNGHKKQFDNAQNNLTDDQKLIHLFLRHRNYPRKVGYADQNMIYKLITNRWWYSDSASNSIHDNYLVMIALYNEARTMQRLIGSLSLLKYPERQKTLRIMLLLEEAEHPADGKKAKGASGSKNLAEVLVNLVDGGLKIIFLSLSYILGTPVKTSKWLSTKTRKWLLGDPDEYNPNQHWKEPSILTETTYQAAIRTLLALPNPKRRQLDLSKDDDVRCSFVLAYVPKVGRLAKTHRKEAQTKPRALNYGLYERFAASHTPDTKSTPDPHPKLAVKLTPIRIPAKSTDKWKRRWRKLAANLKILKEKTEQLQSISQETAKELRFNPHNNEEDNSAQKFIDKLRNKREIDYEIFELTIKKILLSGVCVEFLDTICSSINAEPSPMYLGAHLLRMVTGYYALYSGGNKAPEPRELALLLLTPNLSETWGFLGDLLDKHIKKTEDNDSENNEANKESDIPSILIPVFAEVDYSFKKEGKSVHDPCIKLKSKTVALSSEDIIYKDLNWSPQYCAVYDAEDRPEPDQLLKAAHTYRFYEYLPLLVIRGISNSLWVRIKLLSTNSEIRNLWKTLTEYRRRLKELLNQDNHINSKEFWDIFDSFLERARDIHKELKDDKGDLPEEFSSDYDELSELMKRQYFWWRAGEHFQDYLDDKLNSDWQQCLDKAYPATSNKDALQSKVVCLQGRLTYENLNDNWIISLFKADYATWFNYILPGLHAKNLPIPLGGTSNHFDANFLSKIGGWDAFNVAEDCDLGMWIARDGKRVAVMDSITWEIAEPDPKAWIKQRSRWIKGYMQSYFVHMRNPVVLQRELGDWKSFISFQLTVGAGFLLPMLAVSFYVMVLIYLISLVSIVIASMQPGAPLIATPLFFINEIHYHWILPLGTGSLFVSNVIYFLLLVIGQLRHPKPGSMYHIILWWYIYWVIMIVAAWRALYEYLFKPFHWEKSDHKG